MHTESFEAVDVGAVIQFAWQQTMSHTVARQERHAHPVDFSDRVRIRRKSERRLDGLFAKKLQSLHLIEAGAADDSDWNFVHCSVTTEITENTETSLCSLW